MRATRNRAVLLPALLVAATAAAQEPTTRPEERKVTVSATGTVEREPNQALLLLAVETFAPTAREAAQGNATKMDRLVAALKGLGLAGEKVRTMSYGLNPEYDQRPDRQPGPERIVGYRAHNMVQVTIDSVPRVGAIIDAAVAAGSNRVAGLNFQLRDPQSARLEALRLAVTRARAEAEAIAQALGQQLGPVLQVGTAAQPDWPRVVGMARAMDFEGVGAQTPIEPGRVAVSANVVVTFRLEGR